MCNDILLSNRNPLILLFASMILLCCIGCDVPQDGEVPKGLEQIRVTSPDGQLDAVLVREDDGGAAGGWQWLVYVTARGKAVLTRQKANFSATTLTGAKLVWHGSHLLEIHYDVANIESFFNLSSIGQIRTLGPHGEGDYFVEVRLNPSSPDFSLLTPSGEFKPKD